MTFDVAIVLPSQCFLNLSIGFGLIGAMEAMKAFSVCLNACLARESYLIFFCWQAHVRGYQVRKKHICWAVGILDKAVLRWRRKGAGLRGYKPESDHMNEVEEDEDIVKAFRKERVNAAIDEAVSTVVSMVDSPEARQQYNRMLGKYQEAKVIILQTSTCYLRVLLYLVDASSEVEISSVKRVISFP